MVEYFAENGITNLFNCPSGLGKMSATFCGQLHCKANTKAHISEHRYKSCRFCLVGQLHSGKRQKASGSRLYASLLCSRCLRVSNRLVGGKVCVSCYNRFRENVAGLNAKGNPLKLVRKYHSVSLLLVKENTVTLREVSEVMSTVEGVVSVLLSETENVTFGWNGNKVLIKDAK